MTGVVETLLKCVEDDDLDGLTAIARRLGPSAFSRYVPAPEHNPLAPLALACVQRKLDTLDHMLRLGADPDADVCGDPRASLTLAQYACRQHDAELLGLLLRHGADVDARDRAGCTLLALAVIHGCPDCVDRLLAHGARTDIPDFSGDTPLHFAALHGHAACAQRLIAHGVDAGACNEVGHAAAHYALRGGYAALAEQISGQCRRARLSVPARACSPDPAGPSL